MLRQCGVFPEDDITEDFTLTWLLHRRGHRVALTAGAFVHPREPTSLRELLSQVHRWTSGYAQSTVKHRAPPHGASSFVVVATQVVTGWWAGRPPFRPCRSSRATASKPCGAGGASCGWWRRRVSWSTRSGGGPRWGACPVGFVPRTLIGPLTAWWSVREWVLGRHLLSRTGRHGLKADITPMTAQRKSLLSGCAAAAGVAALVHRRARRG